MCFCEIQLCDRCLCEIQLCDIPCLCRSQHIFIDPVAPRSDYHLTYNCVGAVDNQRTFNDGYHIVHHVNSKVHWADMPLQFQATLERHAANDGA